jgi:hypothetical protein
MVEPAEIQRLQSAADDRLSEICHVVSVTKELDLLAMFVEKCLRSRNRRQGVSRLRRLKRRCF